MRLMSIDRVKIREEAERTVYAVPCTDAFADGVEWFFFAVPHDRKGVTSPVTVQFDLHALNARVIAIGGP